MRLTKKDKELVLLSISNTIREIELEKWRTLDREKPLEKKIQQYRKLYEKIDKG